MSEGFAVIYSDLSNMDFLNLKKKFVNDEHIYNAVVNGSFVLTAATRGGFRQHFGVCFTPN